MKRLYPRSLRCCLLLAFVFPFGAEGANSAAHRPCRALLEETTVWGITLDKTIQLKKGPSIQREHLQGPGGLRVESFLDLTLIIDPQNVHAMAERLSLGDPVRSQEYETELRALVARGRLETSLVPFLPQRARERFGTQDSRSCYYAALNFDEDFTQATGTNVDASCNLDSVYSRYSELGYQDSLQYGDLILFRSLPTAKNKKTVAFHAVRYLGGDFVYHKYAPVSVFHYEFTTIDSLVKAYSSSLVGRIQDQVVEQGHELAALMPGTFRFGDPFVLHMFRFDPEKKKPAARVNPGRHSVPEPAHTLQRSPTLSPIRMEGMRVGRNDPCPCGSGLKFKKCHGKP